LDDELRLAQKRAVHAHDVIRMVRLITHGMDMNEIRANRPHP
jgi:hypothetical protein